MTSISSAPMTRRMRRRKKMKNTIRFLWREIANEPAGIYEQGIILAEV